MAATRRVTSWVAKRGEPIISTVGPTKFDCDVLALEIASFRQARFSLPCYISAILRAATAPPDSLQFFNPCVRYHTKAISGNVKVPPVPGGEGGANMPVLLVDLLLFLLG